MINPLLWQRYPCYPITKWSSTDIMAYCWFLHQQYSLWCLLALYFRPKNRLSQCKVSTGSYCFSSEQPTLAWQRKRQGSFLNQRAETEKIQKRPFQRILFHEMLYSIPQCHLNVYIANKNTVGMVRQSSFPWRGTGSSNLEDLVSNARSWARNCSSFTSSRLIDGGGKSI